MSEIVSNSVKGSDSVPNCAKLENEADHQISELVGAITDSIIVMPGGWGETLPDWIRGAIKMERLVENLKQLKGEEPTGTDAEAVAYLYTASLTGPLDRDWIDIYLHLAGKVMVRNQKTEMPEDIKVEALSEYQQSELSRFKRWLYAARVRARQEKDRSERRERKEQVKRDQEILQPRMFGF